eukprot:16863-Eustigmatos_ZCMA.PRE.1
MSCPGNGMAWGLINARRSRSLSMSSISLNSSCRSYCWFARHDDSNTTCFRSITCVRRRRRSGNGK